MPRLESPTQEIDWRKLLDRAMTEPGHIGDTYSRFYQYSFMNCLFLAHQGAEGPVATYDRWQKLGRQVVKGSKAYAIIRPITVKQKNDDGEAERTFTRFKPVRCLFDYNQTTGDELPPAPPLPGWSISKAMGELEITKEPFNRLTLQNAQGYSYDRVVAVSPTARHPFKTTIHEMAHILLGHTTEGGQNEYMHQRGLSEFEAEASAHLVCKEVGVDSSAAAAASRAYMQGWMGRQTVPEGAIRRVFVTTDTIIKAGRLAIEGGDDAGEA